MIFITIGANLQDLHLQEIHALILIGYRMKREIIS